MIHKLAKLLEKKKQMGGELDPVHRDAKMGVIQAMKDMANEEMGNHLKGLKKVAVSSNSPEGLEEGLDKAKQILHEEKPLHESDMEDLEEDSHEDLDHDNEIGESPEHKMKVLGHDKMDEEGDPSPEEASQSSEDEMSEEELDQKLNELMAKKKKMQGMKA